MLRTIYNENKAYVVLPDEEDIDFKKGTILSSGKLILASFFIPAVDSDRTGKFIFYSAELRQAGVKSKDFVDFAKKHASKYLSGYFHGSAFVTGQESDIEQAISNIIYNNSYYNSSI